MNSDTRAVYESEVRYPSDLIRNGRQHVRGRRHLSPALSRAIRRVRSRERIAELEAATDPRGVVIRVHRVNA